MASKGHLRKSFLSLLSNTIIFLPMNKEEHEQGSPNAAWAALGGGLWVTSWFLHVSRTACTLSSDDCILWDGHVFTKIGLFAKKGKQAVPIYQ